VNLSIRTRLTIIILGITLACLGVGFTIVGFQAIASFRQQRLRAMTVIADVAGDNSVSALAFDDDADVETTLDRLDSFPDIDDAVVYDANGKRFATYHRKDSERPPPRWPASMPPHPAEVREIVDNESHVRLPIVYDGEFYGTIELLASNDALDQQIRSFLFALLAISLGLTAISVLAAWVLQRRITGPIFELAGVARQVTTARDTSLRASTRHGGEIGTLAAGFNAMLARLEAREHEVVSSRDTLRAVIDASPVAIIGVDGHGTIMLLNARASEILRTTEAQAVGKPITTVAPDPALVPVWRRATAESLAGVEVEVGDHALAISSAALPDGGAMVMVADVTERRRVAEALAERATQLQRAQKMDVVGRLAGGVAHDFNNLLTVILASCQMLHLRSSGRAELKNYIDNIQNAANRGAALSRRLLAFSRQQSVDARMIDARAVVTDLERMVRSVVGENIDVKLEATDQPCIVLIDQGQLEQVLLNMVLNARDAMPNGGTLRLRIRVADERDADGPGRAAAGGHQWVGISVTDTGVGMSEETQAHVFEPFFTTKGHGTGLGLATADQITRDAGGEITVDSQQGGGSTFTLWLPRMGGAEARESDVAGTAVVPGHDTVLLVEDEPALRNLVQIILAEAGYHVIAAATANEALALGTAPGVQIDLLLTDVVMPGMSGPQLATELLRRRSEIQVLYMSGYIGDALSEHGLDEAQAALIHKPFKPDHLLKLIRDLLDARPRRARRPSEHQLYGRTPDPGTN